MKITPMILTLLLAVATPLLAQNQGYADMVARVQSAVVSIQVVQEARNTAGSTMEDQLFDLFNRRRPNRQQPLEGAGTGFVVSRDGYIVTNRHVVDNAKSIEVTILGGKTYTAKLIGIDNSLDVAMLKIDGKNLNHLNLGDSDKMRIGDVVLAMGYPLGLGFSVTSGIISGLGRGGAGLRTSTLDMNEYIQTDADFTFGNSGGPLLNTRGEVIAINTMIVERGETFGFSIPSNLMRRSVEQLMKDGQVRRGALGVTIGNLADDAKEYYGIDHGAEITTVTEGMPADKAGVKQFDIILSINRKKVYSANDVIATVSSMLPGEKVDLQLLSNGKRTRKTFALGDRADFTEGVPVAGAPEPEAQEEGGMGFTILPLDGRLRRQLGLSRSVQGVLVDRVEEDSLAEEKGVRRGMLITHVNNKPISSPDDLIREIDKVDKGKLVALRVQQSTGGNFDGASLTPPRHLYIKKP